VNPAVTRVFEEMLKKLRQCSSEPSYSTPDAAPGQRRALAVLISVWPT
jgi:hypothetical protein